MSLEEVKKEKEKMEIQKRRRKKKKSDDEEEEEEGSSDEKVEKKMKPFKSLRHVNPLPGFVDPMTMQEVEKPAISKYGHVLGLSTWEKILKDNPVCPFTKQKLNFYDLTKLSFDNVHLYRDQIINNE